MKRKRNAFALALLLVVAATLPVLQTLKRRAKDNCTNETTSNIRESLLHRAETEELYG